MGPHRKKFVSAIAESSNSLFVYVYEFTEIHFSLIREYDEHGVGSVIKVFTVPVFTLTQDIG